MNNWNANQTDTLIVYKLKRYMLLKILKSVYVKSGALERYQILELAYKKM